MKAHTKQNNKQMKRKDMEQEKPHSRAAYMKHWRKLRREEGWQDIHYFGPAELIQKMKEAAIKWKIENAALWVKR